jgi:hypothetical protein
MLTNSVDIETEPIERAKGLLERAILQMISADEARNRLHFKYVSPEWVGNPGWYFWPKSRPGVYFLRLDSADIRKNQLLSLWQLYYYPHPDETVFEDYSLDEQLVRLSNLFPSSEPEPACCCECHQEQSQPSFADLPSGMGIPHYDIRPSLNSWLFCIGEMSFAWNIEKLEICTVEAPEFSQTWAYMDVFAATDSECRLPLLTKFENDRNIPTWKLCSEFSENLMNDMESIEIVATRCEASCDINDGFYRKRTYIIA